MILDDFALRAHRVRGLIKDAKRRGKTCKKGPFNIDLLRRLHVQLQISGTSADPFRAFHLRDVLLLCFFFYLRIFDLLALAAADIELAHGAEEVVLSILIRGPETDQEKRGCYPKAQPDHAALCHV